MDVLEYQVAVFLTVFVAGLLSPFAMWIVAVCWSVWTLAQVKTNPLLILQFATIVAATVAAAKIRAGRSASPPEKSALPPAQEAAEKKASTEWASSLAGIVVLAYFGWSHYFSPTPASPLPAATPAPAAKPTIAQALPAAAPLAGPPSSAVIDAKPGKRKPSSSRQIADLRSCLALQSDAAMAKCAASAN